MQKYQPEIIFFDWWIGQPSVRPYLAEFAAYYYNESLKHGSVGVITYKHVAMQKNSAVLDLERGQLAGINPDYWQTDTSVSNKSWGYIENDTFKSPTFIVHQLVDVASKNGNLLMNIGPRADGTIPDEVQKVLLSVGSWLKINGDAIYGTRSWKIFGEGPTLVKSGPFHDTETQTYTAQDFRFTTKGADLYAIQLAWPISGETIIQSLGTNTATAQLIQSVQMLGTDTKLAFEQKQDGLHIKLPAKPSEQPAYVFRIVFAEGSQRVAK